MIDLLAYLYVFVAVFIGVIVLSRQYNSPFSDYSTAIIFAVMWPIMGFIALMFLIDRRVT